MFIGIKKYTTGTVDPKTRLPATSLRKLFGIIQLFIYLCIAIYDTREKLYAAEYYNNAPNGVKLKQFKIT